MNPLDEPRHEDHVAERTDAIIDLALGQAVDAQLAVRIRGCPDCSRQVEEHARTIRLIRTGPPASEPMPALPAQVWSGITAELQLAPESSDHGETARPEPVRATPPAPTRVTRRRLVACAAGVVLLGAAGAIGYVVGATNDDNAGSQQANAPLQAQPGTSGAVTGSATVRSSTHGRAVDVRTSGLPNSVGYYEVWLFDPVANKMVAIGTLGAGYAGTFTVPEGLNLDKFHVVDVSAQKLNGDAAHQRSVLRGTLS